MPSLYKKFVESIEANVDDTILDLDNEQLLKLAMCRLSAASLHMQPHSLYHTAVLIYLLLERNDADCGAIFIDDAEDVEWLYMLGMMGDVVMSFVENKIAEDGFPFWMDHATNLLSIILGRPEFKIAEFRYSPYSSRSITTP